MLHATRELFILLKSDMEAMFDNNSKCCTILREVAHAHYYYYYYYYYYGYGPGIGAITVADRLKMDTLKAMR